MKWKKLGRIFDIKAHDTPAWMNNYASMPFVGKISDGVIKIYFSSRKSDNRSLTGWADFNINDFLGGPITVSANPILELGELGMFDEHGTMGCHITKVNNRSYLYYVGWNLGISTPFRNAVGLAISEDADDISFFKISKGPLLDRSIHDSCFVASNCVFKEDNYYRLYYLSCNEWIMLNEKLVAKYNIKYAESKDLISWKREGKIAIDFSGEDEYAISVPRVLKSEGKYEMWYSYRRKNVPYRIGYAISTDGINWQRKDEEVGINVSNYGWDSEMICYPYIFDYEEKRFMLYNGNNYGETGFGIAILEK